MRSSWNCHIKKGSIWKNPCLVCLSRNERLWVGNGYYQSGACLIHSQREPKKKMMSFAIPNIMRVEKAQALHLNPILTPIKRGGGRRRETGYGEIGGGSTKTSLWPQYLCFIPILYPPIFSIRVQWH